MIINSSFISRSSGLKWAISYEELDNFDSIRHIPISSAGALCFYGDKLVLVFASKKRNCWEMPGGGREEGETFEECITREIKEETNMKVMALFPLGYDTLTNPENGDHIYQARFAARVEPDGEFVSDPDGEITEIKLINPDDYKKYFDWGERSDAMLNKSKKILNLA